jgi:transcriptional regulator with XRE-family HTH domain
MAGHTSFRKIREERRRSHGSLEREAAIGRAYRDILRLAELRSAMGVTQSELADRMDVSQANVSRVEHEDDVYLSTLAGYVAALGGRLRVQAEFPESTYTLVEGGAHSTSPRIEPADLGIESLHGVPSDNEASLSQDPAPRTAKPLD